MKTIIIIFISTLVGSCCTCRNATCSQKVESDYTVPTILKDNSGYYLVRCACYPSDTTIHAPNVYPETMKEMGKLQLSGFTCTKYAYPVDWLKY